MKKLFIFLFFFASTNTFALEIKLEKIIDSLDKPWSLSFIDQENIIFTEKSGRLYTLNLKDKKISEIKHNLSILEVGQGGLLDVLYNKEQIYISYSENRGDWKTSTSVAKGKFDQRNIHFNNIFQAEPPIDSGYHFGSRLVIKDKHLYITAGERGKGMIAQDPKQHPGSIIRINLDGSFPRDNPKFKDKKNWLPEIYQIGVRNPQGMALSQFDNKIYMTNHGARGGDWFGTVNYGENYGWKILGWGGTNYSGLKIGPKWKPGFTKAIKYWVPSIAVSAMTIYKGETFKDWNGDALITSLKDQSLRKIKFKGNEFTSEETIFKGTIGRIRDIKIHKETGDLYLLSDNGELWRMYK
ncbi:MAG: glucose dehydrogenase [Candidatus Marinimicrobia bacterium]|nr:glucose dehydrogenase [Candidatus Neomarinimicrobiota bacterium]RPG05901.1 MAG: PQQ-dependent sugar dehydrogenase [Pelagibacteraceae bacterium TMED247]|tara:strand:+ start:15359 stop:16420 length:1062 start_codon:yes stop_codon:yes gene_type:complete